jgi:hypothetical protein
LSEEILKALGTYIDEVQKGIFPDDQHCYHMEKAEFDRLKEMLKQKKVKRSGDVK